MAAFAFYPNKQITTGEGGMVVMGDPELAQTIRSLRNQGRGRMGAWLHHERLGFNYRMDEMSAALGESQMRASTGSSSVGRASPPCTGSGSRASTPCGPPSCATASA